MTVQNYHDMIRLSTEFEWHLLTRREALRLIEDLTEAVKRCPVDVKGKASNAN